MAKRKGRGRRGAARAKAKRAGFRSGFEQEVARQAEKDGIDFEYEPEGLRLEYHKTCHYRPDFVLPNGIIVETKGRFTSYDRTKHLAVAKLNPEVDIRFVFQMDNLLRKGAKSRYSDWCEKHGFKYAFKTIPPEWAEE